MLSVRVPLATLADQQQLQLSPLKGLSLADKENTVSAGAAGGWGRPAAASPGLTRVSPQPPSLSGTRVLASKTARRIFQEPAEPVSGRPGGRCAAAALPAGGARPWRQSRFVSS